MVSVIRFKKINKHNVLDYLTKKEKKLKCDASDLLWKKK